METTRTLASDAYMGVLHLDYSFREESTVRVSGAFTDDMVSLACGVGYMQGSIAVDAEYGGDVYSGDETLPMGCYLGVSYALPQEVELAVRYDVFSADVFKEMVHRVGIGPTLSFGSGLFLSVEYSYEKQEDLIGTHGIALMAGLESTLELPGFQRRTIIRN